jgi:hypothetical protein
VLTLRNLGEVLSFFRIVPTSSFGVTTPSAVDRTLCGLPLSDLRIDGALDGLFTDGVDCLLSFGHLSLVDPLALSFGHCQCLGFHCGTSNRAP